MANFFSLGGNHDQQHQEISSSPAVPTENNWFLYRNDHHNQEIPNTYKGFELWQSGNTPQHQQQFRHPIYPLQDLYSTDVGLGVGPSRTGFDISTGDDQKRIQNFKLDVFSITF